MQQETNPFGYYQAFFDHLNEEHGIIATESQMADIVSLVEKLKYIQHPAGCEWVKASERLPEPYKAKFVTIEGVKSIAAWHYIHERFVDDAGDFHPADQVEWLDESAAGREEAVEFTPDDTAFMIDCNMYPKYDGITITTENDEGASLTVEDIIRLSDVLRRYAILFKQQKEK